MSQEKKNTHKLICIGAENELCTIYNIITQDESLDLFELNQELSNIKHTLLSGILPLNQSTLNQVLALFQVSQALDQINYRYHNR